MSTIISNKNINRRFTPPVTHLDNTLSMVVAELGIEESAEIPSWISEWGISEQSNVDLDCLYESIAPYNYRRPRNLVALNRTIDSQSSIGILPSVSLSQHRWTANGTRDKRLAKLHPHYSLGSLRLVFTPTGCQETQYTTGFRSFKIMKNWVRRNKRLHNLSLTVNGHECGGVSFHNAALMPTGCFDMCFATRLNR